jgi:hypothetical protein
VTIKAGTSVTLNFTLNGTPAFRVTRIRPPTLNDSFFVVVNYPEPFLPGQSDQFVGVYSADAFSTDAILRVTGDGLTFGPTTYQTNVFPGLNPPLNALSVPVHIDPSATPGMRSLVVQQGTNLAYANGFVEISTPFPDYNFDHFDDRFQRQYFPRWTVPDAGPAADPDHDGFDNTAEFLSGTNPTDPNSVLRVESVRLDASGATVSWPGAPGKKYQVYSRPRFSASDAWKPVGSPVVSIGNTVQFLDASATGELGFYRIQAIP